MTEISAKDRRSDHHTLTYIALSFTHNKGNHQDRHYTWVKFCQTDLPWMGNHVLTQSMCQFVRRNMQAEEKVKMILDVIAGIIEVFKHFSDSKGQVHSSVASFTATNIRRTNCHFCS
jgi:hypothetical protein